jgi:Papain fold toxin 1, glutamine deamidase
MSGIASSRRENTPYRRLRGCRKKAASHLYHGAEHLGKKAFKGAGHLAQAALHQGEPLWKGALKQGQKLFKGAVDYADHHKNQVALAAAAVSPALGAALSPDARKFTEAIPGWIDKHVDQLTKGRAQMMKALVKPLEHIPVVGKAAQAYAWFDNKVGEFGGGILKGAGSLVGGVANIVTHPVETATGIYAMAEHVPVMNGLMPNPLKLAHAGADIIFNGADPKTRLETVIDPVKSLQEDGKFGKALVDGFIEPYKKSWSEGKYFEVAGRATFDVGSLFIGAGEANAAIKTGEVASVAGKTAEVANVAGKAGEAANVASKSGKAAEVASTAGKSSEVVKAIEPLGGSSSIISGLEEGTKNLHPHAHGFSIRNVNPHDLHGGGGLNCVKCSIAVESTLSGRPAQALPGLASKTFAGAKKILEETYGSELVSMPSRKAIVDVIADSGNGARGIVIGYKKGQSFSHAFNVVNQDGKIRFLDGQIGTAARNVHKYDQFWFIKTK